MKKPAARAARGRVHKCSVCKKEGHRIEQCTRPAAKEIRRLRKENADFRGKSKRKVLRQESKWRKSPKIDGPWKEEATCLYKGKPAARIPTQTEVRRTRYAAQQIAVSLPSTDPDAVSWLLKHGWIKAPLKCEECNVKRFSDVLWDTDRPPHWRCKHCGVRVKIFDLSIFAGLRASPLELTALLGHYVSSNLTRCPSVPDMVRARLSKCTDSNHAHIHVSPCVLQ